MQFRTLLGTLRDDCRTAHDKLVAEAEERLKPIREFATKFFADDAESARRVDGFMTSLRDAVLAGKREVEITLACPGPDDVDDAAADRVSEAFDRFRTSLEIEGERKDVTVCFGEPLGTARLLILRF